MKIVSITMVLAGIALLAFSLNPTRKICRRRHQLYTSWKFLGVLIIFFIVGYILFLNMALKAQASTLEMIVATILFSGAIFVVMVVRLSLATIRLGEHFAALERHRALHDELTELPNRILAEEQLDHGLLFAKRHGNPLAFVLMDLVRFKEINDSLGHFYGDYVLQEVALRMKNVVRESDTLSRAGGDEFSLVLPNTSLEQAVMISMKIADAIDQPFMIEGHSLKVGISIGIAMYPDHGSDSETLVQRADVAMYDAKRNDVIYAVFNIEQHRTTFNRLVLIGELRDAINKKDMFLCYQPKISIRDKTLIGVEALVRWQHTDRGVINPDDFIPLAEQAGLCKQFTKLVIDKALEQCGKWQQEGYHIPVAVNLSLKNLHDLDFPSDVATLLTKWQIKPAMLLLEITESSIVVDQDRVAKVVTELKEMGLQLSIDDFGTGYSSISYLRKFPAREIKIDKSFIIGMLQNEDNTVIVKSTIEMVHNIGRKVVAEGVEDEETLKLLEELDCDILQGFHLCHPLPSNELQDWLETTAWTVLKKIAIPETQHSELAHEQEIFV
ncbi:MAG: EAL domain-containing protein [Proteobacteria bacterium]|nr:EAL domain-containing protein [Desulfocapsa sp.]MBU3943937.1 EAL domain-containing protein [Pseudomonadota bacterium]MCG2742903.1 EAL domain-containing protein [Desulfobacteraceae bacterium]MDO8946506.1 EAL domain-containing protein [Desulfocapsaceae bacterium]MBU3983119.1 EAL domain-containing protein [Pseudomonadota bacterium]